MCLLVHLNFKMHQQKTHTSKILLVCAPEILLPTPRLALTANTVGRGDKNRRCAGLDSFATPQGAAGPKFS